MMRSNQQDAALVLFSGGQDSTTCLYWAKQNFSRVECLGFNYGQKHVVELEQASKIAKDADVPFPSPTSDKHSPDQHSPSTTKTSPPSTKRTLTCRRRLCPVATRCS